MYAIIETGGKQYRVELGSELAVERLAADPGNEVVLGRVLLVADGDDTAIGRPLVDGAEVRATVIRQDRGEKVIVFKYRPKARHRAKRGHRQELTVLRIADIVHDGRSAAEGAAQEAQAQAAERQEAAQAAAEQASRDAATAAELARKVRAQAEEQKAEEQKAEAKKAEAKKAEAKKTEAKKAEAKKPEAKKPSSASTRSRGRRRVESDKTDEKER